MILQEGLESIGGWCFRYTAIKEIVVPKSVIHIGSNVFPDKTVITRPPDYYTENVLTTNVVK